MANPQHKRQLDAAYAKDEARAAEFVAYRALLRNSKLAKREIVALRPDSTKFGAWVDRFFHELSNLKKNDIRLVPDISRYFSKIRFVTIGGAKVTPRLVFVLRKMGAKKVKALRANDAGIFERVDVG